MINTRVKISGIVSVEEARSAISAGADYIGLNFAPDSPRSITLSQADPIVAAVRGKAILVGVFNNAPIHQIQTIINELSLDMVQLNGNESLEAINTLSVPVMKTFRWDQHLSLDAVTPYLNLPLSRIHALVFSADTQESFQSLASYQQLESRPPFFISTKLTQDNLTACLEKFQPDGIDVSQDLVAEQLSTFCQTVHEFKPQRESLSY